MNNNLHNLTSFKRKSINYSDFEIRFFKMILSLTKEERAELDNLIETKDENLTTIRLDSYILAMMAKYRKEIAEMTITLEMLEMWDKFKTIRGWQKDFSEQIIFN